MSKFASGDQVDGAIDGDLGDTIIAILPTADGNFRFFAAADRERLLQALAEEVPIARPANLM